MSYREKHIVSKPDRLALDAVVAAGLALALVVVYTVDRQPRMGSGKETKENLNVILHDATQQEGLAPRRLRVAVTTPAKFDDMGKLLKELFGDRFTYEDLPVERLNDAPRLSEFDVIFLTCNFSKELLNEGVKTALQSFVGKGGTLYASDLRFDVVAHAFPEFVNRAAVRDDLAPQEVIAEVKDPGLSEVLGEKQIRLRFDLPQWRPAAFSGTKVTELLAGRYKLAQGFSYGPLLVKFPYKKGTVIFTSFHNEKQSSEMELKLLRYLVFTAVNARVDARMAGTMIEGGFAPRSQNLLSAAPGNPEVTKTYRVKKVGPLLFALGFNNEGARLRLTVTSPTGQWASREGVSAFTMEVPDAPVGEWKYTVTAVEALPYPNFPFTVTIGEKGQ